MATQASVLPEGVRPSTREELYDLIRQSSKEDFILRDMQKLGFWAKSEGQPSVPEQIIKRETALHRELNALVTEKRRIEDREALLKQLRKERMLESRRKREENKQKRIQTRKDRGEKWKQRKETEILYLGEGVSGGLNHTEADVERLAKADLPLLADAAAIATAMGLSIGELRYLTFSRAVSKTNHYKRFELPKKTGGVRVISAPMRRMKNAQYWVLLNILNKVSLHDAAHGFVAQRSIVSNASPHVGADVVINMDLKDFFPTITYPRVKGVFRKLGYSESAATIFALLSTEPRVDEVMLDDERWFVADGERFLPQGAPTSPAITNILCEKLDKRLQGLAQKLGFIYTRYADDLTFSCPNENLKNINALKNLVNQIIDSEGFTIHPDKTRIMRKGSRKEVTGIVVNEKVSIDRAHLRKFRALLHQLEKEGPAGKIWGKGKDLRASIIGYANYIYMVDASRGMKYKEQVRRIIAKWGKAMPRQQEKVYSKAQRQKLLAEPLESISEQEEKNVQEKPWWKVW